MRGKERKTYEIAFIGDVPHEGCGQAIGMVMAKSIDAAVKQVIMLLGVGLNLQLTEVKSDDHDVRILGAVGRNDYNFTVRIEEANVIVEPPRKWKK